MVLSFQSAWVIFATDLRRRYIWGVVVSHVWSSFELILYYRCCRLLFIFLLLVPVGFCGSSIRDSGDRLPVVEVRWWFHFRTRISSLLCAQHVWKLLWIDHVFLWTCFVFLYGLMVHSRTIQFGPFCWLFFVMLCSDLFPFGLDPFNKFLRQKKKNLIWTLFGPKKWYNLLTVNIPGMQCGMWHVAIKTLLNNKHWKEND